jgi:cytochrome c oxidase subunit III
MSEAMSGAHQGPETKVAGQPHPYHMVNPSPWPIMGSISALVTALGAVHFFHGGTPIIMIIGLIGVLATMFVWWRDVVHEAQGEHAHSGITRQGLRYSVGLFIASEVMFFVAFFWAFFNSGLLVDPSMTQWPPASIKPMEVWGIPFLNTCILLTSGLAVNWAHHALRHGNREGLKQGLGIAVILGVLFLALQGYEYGHAAFSFRQGDYPSIFFMATGFHGFHVFVGTCFLLVNFIRSLRGDFTPKEHVGFEAAAWYWHFVDVVWIFLFVWVYWWGSSANLPGG